MKENEEKDPLAQWTGEQSGQSLFAYVAEKLPPDEWARLAVRDPEYYHQLRDAQRLVREGKAPHAASLGPYPYPDGALDRRVWPVWGALPISQRGTMEPIG